MRVPGFLWTAILALIPLLIEWLGGDYFTGQQWVPWVVIALGFVAKLIEMLRVRPVEELPFETAITDEVFEGRIRRFFLG